MNKSLANLFDGLQHYIISDAFYNDPHEVLFMFLMGQRPKPRCKFEKDDKAGEIVQCEQIADWHDVPLCHDHRCTLELAIEDSRCQNAIFKAGGLFCQEHMCTHEGCDQSRILCHKVEANPAKELFCEDHACFHCVRIGRIPALEALDEPPRNVCDEHQLCSVLDCQNLALKGEDYCEQHIVTRCQFKSCNQWAIARDLPYCRYHEREATKSVTTHGTISITQVNATLMNSSRSSRRLCIGTNKKKKPCKVRMGFVFNFLQILWGNSPHSIFLSPARAPQWLVLTSVMLMLRRIVGSRLNNDHMKQN